MAFSGHCGGTSNDRGIQGIFHGQVQHSTLERKITKLDLAGFTIASSVSQDLRKTYQRSWSQDPALDNTIREQNKASKRIFLATNFPTTKISAIPLKTDGDMTRVVLIGVLIEFWTDFKPFPYFWLVCCTLSIFLPLFQQQKKSYISSSTKIVSWWITFGTWTMKVIHT